MVDEIRVRRANSDDHLTAMRIIDAALLEIDGESVETAVDAHNVLIASVGGSDVGVLVLSDCHITAIAVRRRRRGCGIGSVLLTTAATRCDRLTATFDDTVRPFYESFGFDIRHLGDGRYRGSWSCVESDAQ